MKDVQNFDLLNKKFNIMLNIENIIKKFKNNFYFLALIIFFFLIDRYTKIKIISEFSENTVFLNEYINFNLIWNTGIGFGLFSSSSNLYYSLISLLIAIVILFIFYLVFISKLYDKFVYTLIISGALGNFYDRVFYKAVPDFIDLHYKDFHWFTFNFADILITLGIILMIFKNFLVKEA